MLLFSAIYFQEKELTLPIFIQELERFITVVLVAVFLFKPVKLKTIIKMCKQRAIMILYSITRKIRIFYLKYSNFFINFVYLHFYKQPTQQLRVEMDNYEQHAVLNLSLMSLKFSFQNKRIKIKMRFLEYTNILSLSSVELCYVKKTPLLIGVS